MPVLCSLFGLQITSQSVAHLFILLLWVFTGQISLIAEIKCVNFSARGGPLAVKSEHSLLRPGSKAFPLVLFPKVFKCMFDIGFCGSSDLVCVKCEACPAWCASSDAVISLSRGPALQISTCTPCCCAVRGFSASCSSPWPSRGSLCSARGNPEVRGQIRSRLQWAPSKPQTAPERWTKYPLGWKAAGVQDYLPVTGEPRERDVSASHSAKTNSDHG